MPTFTISYTQKIDDDRDVSIYPLSSGLYGLAYRRGGIETRLTLSKEALFATRELITDMLAGGALSEHETAWTKEEG